MFIIALYGAVPSLLGGLTGVALARRRWLAWPALIVGAVWTAVVAGYVASTHDPDVSAGSYVSGIVLAAVAAGLLPVAGYYALGRALARRKGWLAVAWLATLIPFGYYMLLVLIVSVGLAHCPPDAYECPL